MWVATMVESIIYGLQDLRSHNNTQPLKYECKERCELGGLKRSKKKKMGFVVVLDKVSNPVALFWTVRDTHSSFRVQGLQITPVLGFRVFKPLQVLGLGFIWFYSYKTIMKYKRLFQKHTKHFVFFIGGLSEQRRGNFFFSK